MNCTPIPLKSGRLTCSRCGRKFPATATMSSYAQCRSQEPPTVYLTDTILNGTHEHEARLLRPPCRHLGERTEQRAKGGCKTGAFYYPAYHCQLHRLCSPFGKTSDPKLIVPCQGCPDYKTDSQPPG